MNFQTVQGMNFFPCQQNNCGFDIRRERSRDAARFRRGRENFEFFELAKLLPLHVEISGQLDKASVVRLAVSYLKLRDFCTGGQPSWLDRRALTKTNYVYQRVQNSPSDKDIGSQILQSVDGFLLALSRNNVILYVSETVSIFLGLSQVDMTGTDIFSYIHPLDRKPLLNFIFSLSSSKRGTPADMPLCIRMKSNLAKRSSTIPCSGYRTVQLYLQPRLSNSATNVESKMIGTIGVATALPPLCLSELLLPSNTLVLRLEHNFSINYVEQRHFAQELQVIFNTSLYAYIHPCDLDKVKKCHQEGECPTYMCRGQRIC